MTRQMLRLGFAALLCAATAGYAQAPSGAPDGSTGQCKDGTYTSARTKSGACKGHKGVKTWFATVGGPTNPDIKGGTGTQSKNAKQTAHSDAVVNPHNDAAGVSGARADAINKKSGNAAVATPNDNGKKMPGPAANGTAGNSSTSAGAAENGNSGRNSAKGSSSRSVAGRSAAPGGGPGMVWLNTETKVYHCYGSRYYGTTKNGKYVSEKDAINMGAHADHGKSCSQQ